jgi:hypothetical protein
MIGPGRYVTLVLLVQLVACGCKEPPTEELSRSPDGRYVVMRNIFGHCGGATVGYHSVLFVVDTETRVWRWNRQHTLLYARGLPRPVVHWAAPQSLEVDLYLHDSREKIVGPDTVEEAAAKAEVFVQQFKELRVTIRQFPEKEGVVHKVVIPNTESNGTGR